MLGELFVTGDPAVTIEQGTAKISFISGDESIQLRMSIGQFRSFAYLGSQALTQWEVDRAAGRIGRVLRLRPLNIEE